MAVKLRLSRIGKKHMPFFRIVAVDSRKQRDGACLENLGTFDPIKGSFIQFHEERINDWMSKGATPSDSVKKLIRLKKEGSDKTSAPVEPTKTRTTKKAKAKEAAE